MGGWVGGWGGGTLAVNIFGQHVCRIGSGFGAIFLRRPSLLYELGYLLFRPILDSVRDWCVSHAGRQREAQHGRRLLLVRALVLSRHLKPRLLQILQVARLPVGFV